MAAGGGSPDGLSRLRAGAQLLHRPERREPVDLVRRLGAVQAQDIRAFPLALRARTEGLTAAAVVEEPGLVRAWLMRGTLHLVRGEDHAWLLALTAPGRLAGSRRRLTQEGVSADDAERAVAIIERTLAELGPR